MVFGHTHFRQQLRILVQEISKPYKATTEAFLVRFEENIFGG